MTKNRRGVILAWLVRVYLMVLMIAPLVTFGSAYFLETYIPLLAYALLPLYVMSWFLTALGIPGLSGAESSCFLGMCDPNAFGWVAASLALLSVFYALALVIDTVLPKSKPSSSP